MSKMDLSKPGQLLDTTGNPLTVYHGTRFNFNSFGINEKPGWSHAEEIRGVGHFFTDDPSFADLHASKLFDNENNHFGDGMYPKGAQIIPAHLSMENPAGYNEYNELISKGLKGPEIRKNLQSRGFDGIINKIPDDGSYREKPLSTEYIAFESKQIKPKFSMISPETIMDLGKSSSKKGWISKLVSGARKMGKSL